jgi:hypothetical protein
MLESAEIGQYSCTKLLRDMEAVGSEFGDDDSMVEPSDDELVHLPESLCQSLMDAKESRELPDDLYTIPDIMTVAEVEDEKKNEVDKTRRGTRQRKEKWGPTLVEKRSSRGSRMAELFWRRLRRGRKKPT